jgi:hypothetical protein
MSTATPADRRTRPAPRTAQDRWVLEGELPEPTWYS